MAKREKGKEAFVIMSFSEKYDQLYHQSIIPALTECGYNTIRADTDPGPANIPSEIIKDIIRANIVIADISEPSPNIFYELGVSHSIGNKTIVISLRNKKREKKLPFDISAFRVTFYSLDTEGLDLLFNQLVRSIHALEKSGMTTPNNLVQEAGSAFFDLRKKIKVNLEGLKKERSRIKSFAEYIDQKDKGQLQDNKSVADKIVGQIARYNPGRNNPLLVSITGSGAIGKSTFSQLLAERIKTCFTHLTVDILPTDSYQLERAERMHRNLIGFDPRAHKLDELVSDLEKLMKKEPIYVSPYDHETGRRLKRRKISPSDILILEGVYAFYPLIAPMNWGLKYYIYAHKDQAKELKLIADFTERGYDIQTALEHADAEYNAYETHILPFLKLADFIIKVDQYWKYEEPYPVEFHRPGLPMM